LANTPGNPGEEAKRLTHPNQAKPSWLTSAQSCPKPNKQANRRTDRQTERQTNI